MPLNHNVVVVICTHLGSKRIARKAFVDIAGVPAIEHILNRLKDTSLPVIIATPSDQRTAYESRLDFGRKYAGQVSFYGGDGMSPLHRMAGAVIDHATRYQVPHPEWIVRVTHDDIIIDARTIEELLSAMTENGATYGCTPKIVEGAGVEVFRSENLFDAMRMAIGPVEHISYFVKDRDPARNITIEPRSSIRRTYRLTMDYPADVLTLKIVMQNVGADATVDTICEFIDRNPYVMGWNRRPPFTIYTCAFTAGRWIEDTIHSVLHSNQKDFEYLVIDDGSTDNTALQVSKFSYDPRLLYIRMDSNRGLASCSNIALDAARGRYVMRVDADDRIMPGTIDAMAGVLQATGAGVVYANYTEMDESGRADPGRMDCPGDVHHHAGCAMMDTRLINELRFKEGLRNWDSHELFTRIQKNFHVEYIREPLWFYRIHDGSMSRTNTAARAQEKKIIDRLEVLE